MGFGFVDAIRDGRGVFCCNAVETVSTGIQCGSMERHYLLLEVRPIGCP